MRYTWNREGLHLIPEHCREGLSEYLDNGRPVGGFLQAVLENNLVDSFSRADDINTACLRNYVQFLYNYAPVIPQKAWGSKEAYREWVKIGGCNGLGKEEEE